MNTTTPQPRVKRRATTKPAAPASASTSHPASAADLYKQQTQGQIELLTSIIELQEDARDNAQYLADAREHVSACECDILEAKRDGDGAKLNTARTALVEAKRALVGIEQEGVEIQNDTVQVQIDVQRAQLKELIRQSKNPA